MTNTMRWVADGKKMIADPRRDAWWRRDVEVAVLDEASLVLPVRIRR